MQCPVCGPFNPPEAARCDCGFDFTNRAAGSKQLEVTGRFNMIIGAISFVVGLLVTLVSVAIAWSVAEAGGACFYVIAWGAVVFGAVQFFRGWRQYSRRNKV